MELKGKAYSHKGLIRSNNEDHLIILSKILNDGETDFYVKAGEPAIFAVADGLGGHNAGEIASRMLLENLSGWFKAADHSWTFEEFADSIGQWAGKMNFELKEVGESQQNLRGMGTTLAGVYRGNKGVFTFSAGDSRIYVHKDGVLNIVTTDHTVKGVPGSRTHILTNCIGASISTFVDSTDITEHTYSGSSIMICSDGLTDMVDDDVISNCIDQGKYDCLLQKALQNGGKDNISYIIIQVV
jgi:PPM family protein phosphatase